VNADHRARHVPIRLFLTCWLIFVLHFATNTVREIYPALSLGDHGSFDVSEYLGLHPDIFEVPGRGAFINNNPGASILGALPYALVRPAIDLIAERVQQARAASGRPAPEYNTIYPLGREFFRQAYERGLDIKFGLAAGVIAALLMAPLSALSVVLMYWILLALTARKTAAVVLALLYALATPVFFRTAQLNQNLLIAHCALAAFALLWQPWNDRGRPRRWSYLLAGLLCGWAVVLDYSGVIVVAVLGVYAVWQRAALPAGARSRADLPLFLAGVAACLSVLMAYQWQAFGNPLFPAQRYMPPTPYSGLGYNGMTWPQPDLLWQTTFGLRFGLFTSAPLLLLALWPPAWTGGTRIVERREASTILAFTVAFLLFCAGNQYGRLQFNSGVRYSVPVVPFLFLMVAGVLLRSTRVPARNRLMPALPVAGAGRLQDWRSGFSRLGSWPIVAFVVLAVYWSWCLAMYRDVEQGPGVFQAVIQITTHGPRLPWLATLQSIGYVPAGPWAWPVLLLGAGVIWAIWRPRGRGRPSQVGRTPREVEQIPDRL
jgi:hypothetical protein